MKSFGLRLKHLRIEKGLTQDELAKKLGVAKRFPFFDNQIEEVV